MRRAICLTALLTTVLLSLGGCDLLNTLDGNGGGAEPQDTRWVVLAARYEAKHPDPPSNRFYNRLVLMDFDDPSHYKLLTTNTDDHDYYDPRFSPDKSKLLFRDFVMYTLDEGGSQFVIYDLENGSLQPLTDSKGYPVLGGEGIWNADGTGFYSYRSGYGIYSPFHHRLSDKAPQLQPLEGQHVATVLEEGLLIIYKGNPPRCPNVNCRYDPYYIFDARQGNYRKHIQNPHLELIKRKGIQKLGLDLAWNEDREQLVFAYRDSTLSGINSKIAVTNLDGSYYREYTSGEYADYRPRWGPNGKYILFDRRNSPESPFSRAMVLNLETGAVRQFAEPEVIDGAVDLHAPDY